MELDENMLRERFDTAVADVTPDVMSLVGSGEQRGRALQRRRRWQAGGGVIATVVVLGAALASGGGLFEHQATGPADTSPTGTSQLVTATPRGLAAAVLTHLDLGTPDKIGGEAPTGGASQSGNDQLITALGYRTNTGLVELQVIATSDLSQWAASSSCDATPPAGARPTTVIACSDTPLPDGTPALQELGKETAQSGTGGKDFYLAVVELKRDGELVAAVETLQVPAGGQDLGVTDLAIPLDLLKEIASDPVIGLQTTQDFNSRGEQIPDFTNSLTSSSGSASAPSISASTASVPARAGSSRVAPSAPHRSVTSR